MNTNLLFFSWIKLNEKNCIMVETPDSNKAILLTTHPGL